MQNIFGYNITENQDAPADGQVFLRASVPEYHEQRLEQQSEEVMGSVKKLISWPLIILQGLFAIVGLGVLRAFFDLWLDEEENGRLDFSLLIVGLGCLAVFALIGWIDHRRRKSITESDEYQAMEADMESAADTSRFLLGIPDSAADLDVLAYNYKVKKGKEKPADSDQDYINLSMYAWVENGELLLANNSEKFAIPLSAVTVRRRVGKIRVFLWWKEEAPQDPIYKPYKIKYDEDSDIFTLRAVYALEVVHGDEPYELLVPDYDWELVLQPMIGGFVPAPTEE